MEFSYLHRLYVLKLNEISYFYKKNGQKEYLEINILLSLLWTKCRLWLGLGVLFFSTVCVRVKWNFRFLLIMVPWKEFYKKTLKSFMCLHLLSFSIDPPTFWLPVFNDWSTILIMITTSTYPYRLAGRTYKLSPLQSNQWSAVYLQLSGIFQLIGLYYLFPLLTSNPINGRKTNLIIFDVPPINVDWLYFLLFL